MTATLKDTFAEQGYLHLKGYFDKACVDLFEERIVDLYAMQARKIGEYRTAIDDLVGSDATNADKLKFICRLLEANDKEALYQVQKFFPQCRRIRELFDTKFLEFCAELIDGNPKTTLIEGPALFVNMPTVQRLLYKWHSEALYYGKRRRFVNVWLPMFGDRTQENGAMSVLPRSHKRVWDASLMAEYTGYDKDSQDAKNHFVQFEIPQNFLTQYGEPVHCESSRSDVIFFDRNLIHTSNANTSHDLSFAVVLRVWDPSDDLTLSGNMEATPYGGNRGRADLVVNP
jgi:hypothetical protein